LVELSDTELTSRHAFPILDHPPANAREQKQWDERLRGITPKDAQPYFDLEGNASETVMHNLRELSNEDKHRVLLARYATIPGREDIPIRVGSCHNIEPIEQVQLFANRPLEDGSEIISAEVTITGPEPTAELGGDLPFDAGFGAGMVRLSGFSQMRDVVSAILNALSATC
jgi:hypothetical protein